MPGRTLPTIPLAEVRSRKTAGSCYVTIGTKVYDITDFLEDHPGGADLILEFGGQDVTEILKDEVTHAHTETAYEILEEHLIGFVATEPVLDATAKSDRPGEIVPLPPSQEGKADLVYEATGLSCAEDLSRETNYTDDYKKHKFLDLNRPLLMQIWNGGFSKEFYLEQIHRPRHYKGGQSAPLFGNFLEPLSKTAWWVIPLVWLPAVAYGTYTASQELPIYQLIPYWLFGTFFWTIIEYFMHRFIFHVDKYVHKLIAKLKG
jgi:4-hydroxysphinganine ceramide fatty acyl 2-hydroxylase